MADLPDCTHHGHSEATGGVSLQDVVTADHQVILEALGGLRGDNSLLVTSSGQLITDQKQT